MSRTSAARDAWRPQTRQDREAVMLELQEVLASPHFTNSKRYPALLRYIVEATLAGKSDVLKERTLGVEVFDRPPSYDTNTDTVVRYTAGEVRKRLSLYYHELERKPAIQISLPAGSYIPEFLHVQDEREDTGAGVLSAEGLADGAASGHEPGSIATWPSPDHEVHKTSEMEILPRTIVSRSGAASRRRWSMAVAAIVVVAMASGLGWRYRGAHPHTALDDFWAPLVRDQRTVLVCTGGSVFKEGNFSGVGTAGKDIEYPFVSIQIASAIARLSGLIERNGATTQVQSSATTPLTELRDQPVILLGGYNNQWTLRLVDPLPFHFAPEVDASIVDRTQATAHWARDHLLPYSSADDYALVARFRDTTTDTWIVVLAGLGRNGTEAAAQFVTSPHYMQLLRDQMGADLGSRNVEAVVKVNVIEGKTGAPSLVAVHVW